MVRVSALFIESYIREKKKRGAQFLNARISFNLHYPFFHTFRTD